MHYLKRYDTAFTRRLLKFLLSGTTAAIVEYLTFLLLFNVCNLYIIEANLISFVFGLITSFILNRRWVFRSDNSIHSDFSRYLTLAIVNSILGSLLLSLLVGGLSVAPYIAKLIVMITIAIWNYIIFSKFIFKQK